MPHDLPKAYDPTAIEDKWAEYWVRENLFTQPTPEPGAEIGEPFTILLPPPNVTGRLHMGHMLNQTEMDILARWHRMKGDPTLWLPGTDHAGIATQMMVEKQVVSEGTSRQEMGREKFLQRVWCWRKQYGGAILEQMKRLGASVDWQREYFTMDANLSVAVREAFTRLYAQGLVYRGAYVVNWCPGCQTAVSDLEVVHEEVLGSLWEIRYPVVGSDNEFLTIATTRPETMLGDVAVAIHPEDERYLHLHGKKLLLPLMNREIPIVLDEWVSRDFGTGAVKITPAHDPNDFALGQRHHLPSINIMDDTAHINEAGGVYAGLSRFAARKRVLEDLEAQGLLGKVHDHKLSVGRCDRSKDVVEPRLSTQWFIKIQPLADRAIQAVEEGHIQFTPEQYKKTYLNWMTNIHDWCISRQLWWGHRIPAWHCATCNKITVPKPGETTDPTACAHCNSAEITQETDVLDTWFSSGLLPVSVFGWPFFNSPTNGGAPSIPAFGMGGNNGTPGTDFSTFYPTSLLVTGFDILFFWVARMIMLGCWFALDVPMADGSKRELKDAVPFKDVYIHALVRDANREKMSKTKGNVIDPIEIVKQYGTDAVRFTLASMASPGTDIAFNVARTEGYRAFANKIWNAARFLFMNIDKAAEIGIPNITEIFANSQDAFASNGVPIIPDTMPIEARWIEACLHQTSFEVNLALENYRFDDAANVIYQFFWGNFCDWYLEIVKIRLSDLSKENLSREEQEGLNSSPAWAALGVTTVIFEVSLRLLSPFMPFLTEEIWHAVYAGKPYTKSIALAPYPVAPKPDAASEVIRQMATLQSLITEIRALRKEIGVEEKAIVPIELSLSDANRTLIAENQDIIERLARVSEIRFVDQISANLTKRSTPEFDVAIIYERTIDVLAERERLTKEIARLEKLIASAEKQLGNDGFLAKAPTNIVEGLKKQESENRQLLEKAKAALATLPQD
jgi:valyl-tRNA synthetase